MPGWSSEKGLKMFTGDMVVLDLARWLVDLAKCRAGNVQQDVDAGNEQEPAHNGNDLDAAGPIEIGVDNVNGQNAVHAMVMAKKDERVDDATRKKSRFPSNSKKSPRMDVGAPVFTISQAGQPGQRIVKSGSKEKQGFGLSSYRTQESNNSTLSIIRSRKAPWKP
ncbi:DNA polymerase epsilon catalytic subunit A [Corchorus olitorius]|uniref:DNA polymerase epsilon catalytic subunit A n=1 Tax=Corchorus olitorius TaxID=93759 RepID=A0A1R3FVE7_9ROSI|nr:DNA polymerase epsilon catalytic subunit A [Corchorus olitorius]